MSAIKHAILVFCICLHNESAFAQPPTYIWAKTLPGNVESIQRGVVVDAAGNVYITGVFFGTVDFDPGAGLATLTPVPYGSNAYIAKYDFNGNFLWVKNIPIHASYGNNSIAIDFNGNVYITGFYSGNGIDFDPGAGVASLSSVSASNDIYMAKYDTNGNYIWVKSFGSSGDDRGNEIITDAAGNVFLTGNFSATVDFDPGTGSANLTSTGLADIFFAKYDCNGNYIWVKQIGGSGTDDVRDIAISSSGIIYLTGNFSSTSDFDPDITIHQLTSAGGNDIFLAKYDANGNYLWANQFGGAGTDGGSALKIDAGGNILVTGIFTGTVDFDQSANVANLSSSSSALFYGKYDANGNYVWTKQLPINFYSMDISLDITGNILIAGYYGNGYTSPIDMDPGPGVANLSVPGNLPPPTYNILGKYDAAGNYLWAGVFGHQCYCSVMAYKSSLAIDANGYLYYSGIFNGSAFGASTVDFDPGTGVANLTAPSSVDNTFFVKYGIATNPLPVELISLTGENRNNVNYLYWSTASETNNNYFNIERSGDGKYFEIIGMVEGHNNSNQVLNYDFIDNNPLDGINYYRLEQVDYDGKYNYSRIVALKNKSKTHSPWIIQTYESGIYLLHFEEMKNGVVKLLDGSGRLVESIYFENTTSELKLDLRNCAVGLFLVEISNEGEYCYLKFCKN